MRSTHRLFVFLFAAIFLIPPCFAAPPAADANRIVVMVSIDGLAAHYIDDPKADIPTLRQLAADGARADSMRAVAPTVTWPNHTTLVTGDYPARHGVVSNNYFDRATGKQVTLIADPVFDKDQIVKVPTIYDIAHSAGLKTAGIRWPASRNAHSLDWTMPDCLDLSTLRKYTTPSVLADCLAAGFTLDTPDPKSPGRFGQGADQDKLDTQAFNLILHSHRPQLALLHIIDVDHTQHLYGPNTPEAYAAIKGADSCVHDIVDELNRDFPSRYTIVIVSDHGFSAINRMIFPNVILRDAGLINVKGIRAVGGSVHIVPQGGAAMIYILDKANRDDIIARVTKAFTGVKGVSKILGPDALRKIGVADPAVDPKAPDMMLFAAEGNIFGDTAGGALAFHEKPERKGSHGHDPELPDLHAVFIASGQGIKPGAHLGEISNTSVAPTLAKLLDLNMPDTDGKPLTDILTQP